MAILPSSSSSSSLRLASSIPSPRASFLHKLHAPPPHLFLRASSDSSADPDPDPEPEAKEEDEFDSRLSQVRLRYRSGTGKKAELRKGRKGKKSEKSGMYLPPVALKEAVSGGLKVEFGFSRYSERVNGRIAALGLSALLLVEIATGKGVINYHTPAIVLIQLYFVAALCALYIKYEKERVSVWPTQQPLSSSSPNER